MIQCDKCKGTVYSMKGKCLNCGNQQFKAKATIVRETNAIVEIMVEQAVDRVIMAMMRKAKS